MALNDIQARNAKPKDRPYSMADEKGLSLLVQPNGGKWWRFRYRFDGKAKMLSLGIYPDVGLKDVRDKRDDARKLLAEGVDPSSHRKAAKTSRLGIAENSFEVICREWLEGRRSTVEPAQHVKTLARMVNDVFPWMGSKPITDITAPEVLIVLRRMDDRGARYSAHKTLSEISRTFRYAMATVRAERDPCPSSLSDLT